MAKKKVHHEMVAYSGELSDVLQDALRDNLSPEAVVGIVAYLQPANAKKPSVQGEIVWFRELLEGMLGDEVNDLFEEIGV